MGRSEGVGRIRRSSTGDRGYGAQVAGAGVTATSRTAKLHPCGRATTTRPWQRCSSPRELHWKILSPDPHSRALRPSILTSPPSRTSKRALSWFKEAALTELRHAHELVELLKGHDLIVEMITTDRPGYVVYEDEYQIVAEPFHDTQT